MSNPELGRRLYEILPAVYRARDRQAGNHDLREYLAAIGDLLDMVYATLDQRLADAFPDEPMAGLACQEWLLPYLADLLDVRLMSPEVSGRRAEIANAIAWRQRKGTLATIEDIAEAVGQIEVEVQEGWKRVATTPRIGLPLLPASTMGYENEPYNVPGLAARHPGLPAVTVDLRCPSRAVQTDPGNPAAHQTRFDSQMFTWRQASIHGTPCFPGTFQDVSRRTVDLRTPTWRHGHYHPRRIAMYTPPPAGFFPSIGSVVELRPDGWDVPGATVAYKPAALADGDGASYSMDFPLDAPAEGISAGNCALLLVERSGDTYGIPVLITEASDTSLQLLGPAPPAVLHFPAAAADVTLVVGRVVLMNWNDRHQTEYAGVFAEYVEEGTGVQVFCNRTVGKPWFIPVHVQGLIELDTASATVEKSFHFQDLVMQHKMTVHKGRLSLSGCAARKLEVHTMDTTSPVIDAVDCLFDSVQAATGLTRLEYCTVLEKTLSEALEASDCIFLGPLRRHHLALLPPARGCLRYSRIPTEQDTGSLSVFRCNRDVALMFSSAYGVRSCGVLHPESPRTVRFGAEDGGEMGAYHSQHHSLRQLAVMDKVREHAPLGMEPILIPDASLLLPPHE